MKYEIIVAAIVGTALFAVQAMDAKTDDQLGRHDSKVVSDNEQNVSPPVEEVDLGQKREYKKYTAEEQRLRREYPELYKTKAQILVWSATWCGPCITQKTHTKALMGRFQVIEYDYDTESAKWLHEHFKGDGVPYTAIVVEGKLKKSFYGVTPSREISQYAADCLKEKDNKNGDDKTKRVDIGPLHVDWSDGVDVYWERRGRDSS